MNIESLATDCKTMKELMTTAQVENLKLKTYCVAEDIQLEVIVAQNDFALVKEHIPEYLERSPEIFVHPYGGMIGYTLK